MRIAIDRFNLIALGDALDRDCFVRAVQGLREAIDPEFWQGTMKTLLKDSAALLIEFTRDYEDVKRLVGRPEEFSKHDVIPGPEQIEQDLPRVYITHEELERVSGDSDALIAWHIRRLAWVAHTFLQFQGSFTHMASAVIDMPQEVEVEGLTPESTIVITGTAPDFMHQLLRRWHACHRLLGEYLSVKSDLLNACGFDVSGLSINLGYEASDFLTSAERAILTADPNAAQHLLNAFRYAIVEQFQLRERLPPAILTAYSSVQLYTGVIHSGITWSDKPEVLGNVLVNLEQSVACGSPVLISTLYPFCRLIEAAVAGFADLSIDDAARERLAGVLQEGAVSDGERRAEAGDQADLR